MGYRLFTRAPIRLANPSARPRAQTRFTPSVSPADVIDVSLIPGQKACRVIVPDDQLSLAIGKEGQNARLAARLTGYKIDIKPASQAEPAEETEEA